ncbi:MAG: hypothetical protein M0Z78_08975 [Betaproteobacteria bacterium]|nr:hypothetical protein [Betaproteobacteria bacterium]
MGVALQNGTKIYYFPSSLASYLGGMLPRKKFNFGDWLMTLSDGDISKLKNLCDQMETGSKSATDELVLLLISGLAAETLKIEIKFKPEKVDFIGVFASFESLRRAGLIKIIKPLKLSEDNYSIALTQKGLEAEESLRKMLDGVTFH